MAEMNIGGETFNVEVDGPEGAPVLMLSNSLGTTLEMWDAQMPALTKQFRVVRYDSRGHGKSTAADGPYSIEQLGRDALAILDALKIRKAHWLGLSMGGMVGMWLLSNAGKRIGRAVLANTGAYMGSPDIWNTRIRTARSGDMDSIATGSVDRWFTKEFQEKDPDAVKRIIAMVRATPPLGYASCCAAIRDMDQRESIRSIRNEVLVIVGKQDPATPPAMGGLIAGAIPNSKLIDLDAAHLSNIEADVSFTRAAVAFLTAPDRNAAATQPVKPAKDKPTREKASEPKAKPATKEPAAPPPAPAAKKAGKKASKKPAAKKATKKSAKKASKKSAEKSATGAARKTAKKAASKTSKQAARKSIRNAAKKAGKKTAKKTGKKASKSAQRAGKKITSKKAARKTTASKKTPSKKTARKTRR